VVIKNLEHNEVIITPAATNTSSASISAVAVQQKPDGVVPVGNPAQPHTGVAHGDVAVTPDLQTRISASSDYSTDIHETRLKHTVDTLAWLLAEARESLDSYRLSRSQEVRLPAVHKPPAQSQPRVAAKPMPSTQVAAKPIPSTQVAAKPMPSTQVAAKFSPAPGEKPALLSKHAGPVVKEASISIPAKASSVTLQQDDIAAAKAAAIKFAAHPSLGPRLAETLRRLELARKAVDANPTPAVVVKTVLTKVTPVAKAAVNKPTAPSKAELSYGEKLVASLSPAASRALSSQQKAGMVSDANAMHKRDLEAAVKKTAAASKDLQVQNKTATPVQVVKAVPQGHFSDASMCDYAKELRQKFTPEELLWSNFPFEIPTLALAPVLAADTQGLVSFPDGRKLPISTIHVVDFRRRRNRFAPTIYNSAPAESGHKGRPPFSLSRAPRDIFDNHNEFTLKFIHEWQGKIMTPEELQAFRIKYQGGTPEEVGQYYAENFASERYDDKLDEEDAKKARAEAAALKRAKAKPKSGIDPRLQAILDHNRRVGKSTTSFITKEQQRWLVRDWMVNRTIFAMIVGYVYYHYPYTMWLTGFVISSIIILIIVNRYHKYMDWLSKPFEPARFLGIFYSEDYQRDLYARMRAHLDRKKGKKPPATKF
jgi:hypothetical protein